jgi:hypothetical protein
MSRFLIQQTQAQVWRAFERISIDAFDGIA